MKRFFVTIFVGILFLASCDSRNQKMAENDIYYTCSMHPQVISDKPGKCPICHMDLVPVTKVRSTDNSVITLNDHQILLGNIKTDTIGNSSIGDEVRLTGTLNFNQYKMQSVSSRVMGRVERLYYKSTGDYIKSGAPIADIYSEELNNAKQEYLLVLERRKMIGNDAVIDFNQLLESAKNKLLLWGMTEVQVQALAKGGKAGPTTTLFSNASGYITTLFVSEGDYISEGGTILTLADLSTLWAEAQMFSSQMSLVTIGSTATVRIPDLGNKEINGRIDFVNPEISPETRINLVRVAIPNAGNMLRPGMPVYVVFKNPKRTSLSLPIDAVIRDGNGATVWVQTAERSFKNIMVRTGLETDNTIEITSGLKEGDVVVVSGAYLLNSEFIFKNGADPMAGHDM